MIGHKEIVGLKEIMLQEKKDLIIDIMIEIMVDKEATIDLKEETTTELMTEISTGNNELIMLNLDNTNKKDNKIEREELLFHGLRLQILDQPKINLILLSRYLYAYSGSFS